MQVAIRQVHGLVFEFGLLPTPPPFWVSRDRGDVANDHLTAAVDLDVLDANRLLALPPELGERLDLGGERAQQLGCERAAALRGRRASV